MKAVTRRLLFWILLAGYAGGSVWWLLHVPHEPEKLLRAVPGSASVVSWHDNLAGRFDAIAAHPVTAIIAGALGSDASDLAAMKEDPAVRVALNTIADRELLVAYVPTIGYESEPAWVFASWMGGASHRLRWSMAFVKAEGLAYAGEIGGWPVWTYAWNRGEGDIRLSFALVEGMIVGCLSPSLAAMETVIAAYNGEFPSVRRRADRAWLNARLLTSALPDRLWMDPGQGLGAPREAVPWFVEYALDDTTGGIRGSAWSQLPGMPVAGPAPLHLADLASYWKNHPIAVVVAGESFLRASGISEETPYAGLVMDTLNESGGSAAAVALFGGNLSGRLKGIKVPTIMAAVPSASPGNLGAMVRSLTDRWNAAHRWGVVPVAYPAGTSVVYRLEGTTGNLYASLAATEQVSFAQAGDWILASSNLKGLVPLVTGTDETGPGAVYGWAEQAGAAFADGAFGYAGIDLVRGAETLRLAITAYSLKLLFEDASGSRDTRQTLNEIKAWLDILARFERLHLVGSRQGDEVKVAFTTGS